MPSASEAAHEIDGVARAQIAENNVRKLQIGFQHAEQFLNQQMERIRYLEAQNRMLQLDVSRLQGEAQATCNPKLE